MKRALATAAVAGLLVASASGQTITPFVTEGDPAPGTFVPPDLYATLARPNISEAGHICFTAATDFGDAVVYVDSTLVAQEGAFVAGAAFTAFEPFETAQQVNVVGDCIFIASLGGGASLNRGLFQWDASDALVSDVLLEGDAAPGIPGRIITDFGFAGIFNDGGNGFLATLDNASTTDDSVIYRNGVPLYREGDAVPGTTFTWDGNFDEIQWNGAGDVIFEGNTSGPGGFDMVIFRNRGGVEEIVHGEGQVVAARGGNDFVSLILQTALAENGQWAFRGSLDNAPSNADSFVLAEAGYYAQEGDPIAELPGAVLGNFNGIDVNSHGDVVHLNDIIGGGSATEGLFLNGQLIMHTGMQPPGQTPDLVITDIAFEEIFINDARQIVVGATYNVPGGPAAQATEVIYVVEFGSACLCETDGDSTQVNVFDLLAYLDLWFASDAAADIDGTSGVNVFDLLTFLDCWFPASAGSPC